MINWLRKNFGPEARYERLQKDVKRKEYEAQIAEAEIPLLEKKEKALEAINKRKELKDKIRKQQMERFNPDRNNNSSPSFLKLKEPKSEFKLKTPTDRVFGK
jgi:ribosome-binding ATPase YchF (GTP1/OBG family)